MRAPWRSKLRRRQCQSTMCSGWRASKLPLSRKLFARLDCVQAECLHSRRKKARQSTRAGDHCQQQLQSGGQGFKRLMPLGRWRRLRNAVIVAPASFRRCAPHLSVSSSVRRSSEPYVAAPSDCHRWMSKATAGTGTKATGRPCPSCRTRTRADCVIACGIHSLFLFVSTRAWVFLPWHL